MLAFTPDCSHFVADDCIPCRRRVFRRPGYVRQRKTLRVKFRISAWATSTEARRSHTRWPQTVARTHTGGWRLSGSISTTWVSTAEVRVIHPRHTLNDSISKDWLMFCVCRSACWKWRFISNVQASGSSAVTTWWKLNCHRRGNRLLSHRNRARSITKWVRTSLWLHHCAITKYLWSLLSQVGSGRK